MLLVIGIVGTTVAPGQSAFPAELYRRQPHHAALREKYAGRTFAVALFDPWIIGAAEVSLSTAYATGDVFSFRHTLHRRV